MGANYQDWLEREMDGGAAEIQAVWEATGAKDNVFDEHGTELERPSEVVAYMRRMLDLHPRRVQELLEANNRYLQRARDAEELIGLLGKYAKAKFGHEWWPGNPDAWLDGKDATRLRELLK